MNTVKSIASDLLGNSPAAPSVITLSEAMDELMDHVESDTPTIQTIPCGVDLIDETTGGLVRGEYVGMIAAPGLGKSTIGDAIAAGCLKRDSNIRGLVFALETAVTTRAARLLGCESVRFGPSGSIEKWLSVGRILRGGLTADQKLHCREVVNSLRADLSRRLQFVDSCFQAAEIAGAIRAIRPDVVLIDHMGLVESDNLHNGTNVDRFDESLHVIVKSLRDVNAAGILIAEVSKLGLVNRSAGPEAVRGSARFGSLAGAMMSIDRDESTSSLGSEQDQFITLNVQIWKNRHGVPYQQQRAKLFGDLAYVCWGKLERMPSRRTLRAKD